MKKLSVTKYTHFIFIKDILVSARISLQFLYIYILNTTMPFETVFLFLYTLIKYNEYFFLHYYLTNHLIKLLTLSRFYQYTSLTSFITFLSALSKPYPLTIVDTLLFSKHYFKIILITVLSINPKQIYFSPHLPLTQCLQAQKPRVQLFYPIQTWQIPLTL